VLKMPSGELRKILINCVATVGVVSNSDHSLQSMGKAGRNRWKGIRPRNRGVAMNPVDHPMGGGEGKASVVIQEAEQVNMQKERRQENPESQAIN
jgi:large subunit ribosomal protein L2